MLFVASCGSGSGNHVEVGSVSFDLPQSWRQTDSSKGKATPMGVFAPETNDAKETITVIRAPLGPIAEHYGAERLGRFLEGAQRTLPDARASHLTAVSTEHGLAGMRIDVDFARRGTSERYHRIHVVLADGQALVHVMYTARTPDTDLKSLQLVLDSLREES